jgi:pyrrolidone-carboxylate peptidase
MTRGLIYGFKPYDSYKTNITEELISAVAGWKRCDVHVFQVRFDRGMFEDTFHALRPAWILGLGQHPRARKIRIEGIARNTMWADRLAEARPIEPGAPLWSKTSLCLPPDELCTHTRDAGSYVCNFSMWVANKWCHAHGVPFGFLHIPRRIEFSDALAYLKSALDSLSSNKR